MARPTISGRTSWQFAGLFISSISSDTCAGFFSLLMSTISGCEVVQHADQETASERPTDLVEAADDGRDEGDEPKGLAVGELGEIDRRAQEDASAASAAFTRKV